VPFVLATAVGLVPIGLCLVLILSSVERGERVAVVRHPVRAVRRMFAPPEDEEEDEEPA
jgi:hypothetical protein